MPSKTAFIIVLLIITLSGYLFQNHLDLIQNGSLQDAKIVGCDSKYTTRKSGSTRFKVLQYTPIAVSQEKEKAVGTIYIDKDWCEASIGRDVQIYIHPENPKKSRIATFFQFWFFPTIMLCVAFSILLGILSTKLVAPFTLIYIFGAAFFMVQEFGLISFSQNKPTQGEDGLSTLSLNQCIQESLIEEKIEDQSQIKRLLCQDAGIDDLSHLSGLNNLEEMYLQGNKLTSLKTLPPLPKLKVISVAGNKTLTSLEGINNAPSLEELQGNKSSISDLNGVETLQNLKIVGLMMNKITDVSAFSTLENLEDVTLNYNEISDISSFSNKEKLKEFQVYSNNVSDITPLFDNTAMTIVGIRGKGNVPCDQITELRARLSPETKVWGQKECD